MENKGLIKFLLVVLVIVSVIQCSFILPTRKVEKQADEFAAIAAAKFSDESEAYSAEKQARVKYLDSISDETILSIPLLKSYTYNELKNQNINLGLDLSGGYSAVLQVDLKELLHTLANKSKDETFNQALNNAEAELSNSQSDYITLFGDAFNKIADGKKLNRFFYRNLSDDLNTQSSDGEVINVLRNKANETVGLTFKLLKERIDKMGVTQPNISLDAARDLILVELPGVDNTERAEGILQSSANLEFWHTYRWNDNNGAILNALVQADGLLKRQATGEGIEEEVKTIKYDTTYNYVYDSLGNTIDSTEQLVERAADPFADQGPLLSMLSLNGINGNQLKYPSNVVFGAAERNKKTAIMDMLKLPEVAALFPRDSEFMWGRKPIQDRETNLYTKEYGLYLIRKSTGDGSALLGGEHVTQASASPNPGTGEIEVSLAKNSQGAKLWADMTTEAATNGNREIAISLDDEVVSSPFVKNPITGGRSSISGGFSMAEADDLSNMLEIGKLPASVKIIQNATVGPSLGKENIRKSTMALLVGLGILLLFMVLYYGGAGIVSIVALMVNLFFIFGALSSFGTVLTLPGFAGIILTIGMAVDANVIIFERIREELRIGKTPLLAIADGFKNSYSAIIDANVTTLLVAMVLAYFGLGPIKGFAVILIIGVISSLITAVLMGRLLIDWWTNTKGNNLSFWTGWSKNMFANMQIDWIGKRKIAYAISGTIILAGLVSMFTRGFDLGVDFSGGYQYSVQFANDKAIGADDVRQALGESFGNATVKAVDTENTFNIVTNYLIDDSSEGAGQRVKEQLHSLINPLVGGTLSFDDFNSTDLQNSTHIASSSKVGPTIADDIKNSSFKAGIFALLLVFLYIFLRFSKWQYSLGAVGALFHDSLVVLGLFSILHGFLPISLEIDQNFIAAILTVIGYSINDTVVVFDRIREYLGIYTNKSTDEVLNMALNSTFSRTVITSFTTLLVIAILLIFGGSSTKGFAFALFVGVVVGTYSSIFVATPIVRDLSDDLKPKQTKTTKKSFSRGVSAS